MMLKVSEPSVFATVGLPASGKTSWARRQVDQDSTGHLTIVNRDSIRTMLKRPFGTDEQLVTSVQRAAIRACLESGKSVIVDDTNLNRRHLDDLQAFSLQHCRSFTLLTWFLFVSPAECVKRDACRGVAHVGRDVIMGLYESSRKDWSQLDNGPFAVNLSVRKAAP